jgi:glutathione-regulated potassium-efflux system ancillary protein KefC
MLVQRELFESSLVSAACVLELMGQMPDEVKVHVGRFRAHNLALLEQMYPHHKDRAKLIAVAKQGREQLEAQMAQERAERQQHAGGAISEGTPARSG